MLTPSASPALRRRVVLFSWIALALAPVGYVVTQIAAGSRNFPFWDELDSAIDFIVRLSTGPNWRGVLEQFFAVSNEHRTVTSRIIFAVSYWMTGTVNFHVIGIIGNAFIFTACGALIWNAARRESRLRLAVVLALLVFQLEHFENFIWSGASIDHFQVVMLAVLALMLVTRGTAPTLAGAITLAVLATFTLAHGCVVWAVGALWLAHQREWRRLSVWMSAGAAALVTFFAGFTFNPGHNIPTLTLSSVASILTFWVQLVGSPLALGDRNFAFAPGLVLLVLTTVVLARGGLRRHPVPMLVALFGLASLVLVAFGRVQISNDSITSRYMILSALPWAMILFVLLEDAATPEHPYRWLAWAAPALIGLNISADVAFQVPKEAFIEVRDRAATHFKGYGHAGEGISRMYPLPRRADEILAAADARGVYHLGRVSDLVEFPSVKPSERIISYVDELVVNDRAVTVGGWAMIPGRRCARGQVYLVLESENSFLVYSTLTLQRPDVAKAYQEPKWRLCGFRAVIGRERVPIQNFRVGVLIADGDTGEFKLLSNQLRLADHAIPKHVQLASSH